MQSLNWLDNARYKQKKAYVAYEYCLNPSITPQL